MAADPTTHSPQSATQRTDLPTGAAAGRLGPSAVAGSSGAPASQAAHLAGRVHGSMGAPGSGSTTSPSGGASVQQAAENIKDSAQSAVEDLGRTGKDFLAQQKAKAADQITCFSGAIHTAAQHLREDGNASAAEVAEMAANRLESVARYLGDRDLRSLMSEVERAARRRPELFLGGMFLVGLGISRFLKASRSDEPSITRAGDRYRY